MFTISQEINQAFSPGFSSNRLRTGSLMMFAQKELYAISREISKEFSPQRPDVMGFYLSMRPSPEPLFISDIASSSLVPGSQMRLAASELFAISQNISEAFSPRFSSKMTELMSHSPLTTNELLDISEEITRDFATAPILGRHELTLLSVDPRHLHAYWHVDEPIACSGGTHALQAPLTLRIYAQPNAGSEDFEPETWFDVAIEGLQNQKTVVLPAVFADTVYSAAIGKSYADNSFSAFAYSNLTSPPRGSRKPDEYKGITLASRAQALSSSKLASGQGKLNNHNE